MILCDRDLRQAVANGELGITPLDDKQYGPTSIDLRLGPTLLKYTSPVLELGKDAPDTISIEITPDQGYRLQPGEFVLGCTLEHVRLANGLQGFVETKGDVARAGIQVHGCDGHIEPGSDHTITLEISNRNNIPVVIFSHVLICQIYVHRLTGMCDRIYRGKYYRQEGPSIYKVGG